MNAIDPYYYQSRLRDIQGQRAITTGRALSPEDTTAILNSEFAARYQNEVLSREQKRADAQLAIQQRASDQQAEAIKQQGLANTIGGVGQLGLGYAALKTAGVFGAGAGATTGAGASVPVATATGGYGAAGAGGQAGAAWGGTVGTAGTGGTATMPGAAGAGGMGASVAYPVAAGIAGGWAGHAIGQSKEFMALTPWGGKKTEGIMGGVAGGAAAGAMVGSVVPVVGTVIGGIIGGVVGGATAAYQEGTVICTELHRQGYIPKEIMDYEYLYRIDNIDMPAYIGYRKLADPVVSIMRKSKVITYIVKPFGVGVAYEMAHRANAEIKGSILGSIILYLGLPLCRQIAKRDRRKSICLIS